MTNYEAVYNRRSVRKYKMELLPADLFKKLNKVIDGLLPLYPEIPWKFILFNAMDNEGKTRGMFGIKAPYYLVCYTGEGKDACRQAGYLTEQVVLYLTAHGIGTCYLGGVRAVVEEEPEEMTQRIVVAFGYADGSLYRESSRAKRLSMKDICVFKEEITEEEEMMLAAARLAPSTMNGQPWRFVVYRNRIHVFACENLWTRVKMTREMMELDMGIVLYHIALAAEELWLDVDFVYNSQLAERSIRTKTYVISVMIN